MLVLNGCSQKEVYLYYIDYGLGEVSEHAIVDYKNVIVSETPRAVYPLAKSDGMVCVTPRAFREGKEAYLKSRQGQEP